jgi:hypothetical protein
MSVVSFTGNRQLYYKATKQFGDAMLSLETRMNGCFDLNECIYTLYARGSPFTISVTVIKIEQKIQN